MRFSYLVILLGSIGFLPASSFMTRSSSISLTLTPLSVFPHNNNNGQHNNTNNTTKDFPSSIESTVSKNSTSLASSSLNAPEKFQQFLQGDFRSLHRYYNGR